MPTNRDPIRRFLELTLILQLSIFPMVCRADGSVGILIRTLYMAEVANYCGLMTDLIALGFRQDRDRIIADYKLSSEDIDAANRESWKMGYAEWQNRGLGGFRNWCRTEGMQATERFRTVAKEHFESDKPLTE
jgi:hypothetical protein